MTDKSLQSVVWGAICMCLAAPTTYTGFAAVRFLLGFSEGAVSPAFVTITSYWYKPREHTVRTAWVVSHSGYVGYGKTYVL